MLLEMWKGESPALLGLTHCKWLNVLKISKQNNNVHTISQTLQKILKDLLKTAWIEMDEIGQHILKHRLETTFSVTTRRWVTKEDGRIEGILLCLSL